MKKFNLLFLLLLVSLTYSVSLDLDLPAVSSENYGSLVNVNITIEKGDGKIYFSIPPYTGVSYQESFMNALFFVESKKAGFSKENNFFVDFEGEKTSSVEGASGGVATSIILNALADNKKINSDIIVTGEITKEGEILPVGGIPEKLIASFFSNKSMFFIPDSTYVNEKIIAYKLSKEFEFPVYEYSSFDEIYSIYTLENDNYKQIKIEEENFSNVISLGEVETNIYFNGIVSEMFNDYSEKLNYIKDSNNPFFNYFNLIYINSLILYEKGYSYSAGNELFLTIETLSYLTSTYSDEEFEYNFKEINVCLNNTKENLDNFNGSLEYYIASDVRYVKAKDVIDSYIKEKDNPSIRIYSPGIFTRAELWCESAEFMSIYEKENDFDKISLKRFIEQKLLFYSGNSSSEINDARKYYSQQNYGASLNEIISYEGTFKDCENFNFNYDWSKMMYNHALYLNTSSKYGSNSFDEISKYACSYERILNEYNSYYEKREFIDENEKAFTPDLCSGLCVIFIFILFMLSIIYYVLNRR